MPLGSLHAKHNPKSQTLCELSEETPIVNGGGDGNGPFHSWLGDVGNGSSSVSAVAFCGSSMTTPEKSGLDVVGIVCEVNVTLAPLMSLFFGDRRPTLEQFLFLCRNMRRANKAKRQQLEAVAMMAMSATVLIESPWLP